MLNVIMLDVVMLSVVVPKTVAYYGTELITAVKSFMIQPLEVIYDGCSDIMALCNFKFQAEKLKCWKFH
jgi:hypothetical protein